jgi:hypothetical protein
LVGLEAAHVKQARVAVHDRSVIVQVQQRGRDERAVIERQPNRLVYTDSVSTYAAYRL